MAFFEIIHWGLRQIKTRLLESLLIMLGIGLGVAVICCVVTAIEAYSITTTSGMAELNYKFMNTFKLVSEDKVFKLEEFNKPLLKVSIDDKELRKPNFKHYQLIKETNLEGLEAVWFSKPIEERLPHTEEMNYPPYLLASPEVFQVGDLSLVKGDLFREDDLINKNKVVVLGDELADYLFPNEDPLGKDLILKTERLKVIGVVHREVDLENIFFTSFIDGVGSIEELNKMAYIPYFSYQQTSGEELDKLYVLGEKGIKPAVFYNRLKDFVSKNLPRGIGVSGGYLIYHEYGADESAAVFSRLIGIIGCTVFLIAALNILNLMMARVLSRYKQIGISAALGASRKDIFHLFLGEALILGFLGSIVGIPLSYAAVRLASKILVGLSLNFSWLIWLIGAGVAFLSSLIFGLYPASQAAKVRPANALKMD